jgi:RNA polymerase sigma factor (sigma-70 family)
LQTLEEYERRQLVREAIANPKRQREAVFLRHGEGLSTSEIAQIMGVSEVSVRSLISKGLARIAQEIRRKE